VAKNGKYYYRLKHLFVNGGFEYSEILKVKINIPKKFNLFQSCPNPFQPGMKVHYATL